MDSRYGHRRHEQHGYYGHWYGPPRNVGYYGPTYNTFIINSFDSTRPSLFGMGNASAYPYNAYSSLLIGNGYHGCTGGGCFKNVIEQMTKDSCPSSFYLKTHQR